VVIVIGYTLFVTS